MLTKEINEVRVCSIVKKSIEDAYQQGRIDMLKEVYKHTQKDYYETLIDWVKDRLEHEEQIKEQADE